MRFGPFTCFIGHNGVGKSNLFDAIHFLSSLAGALTSTDEPINVFRPITDTWRTTWRSSNRSSESEEGA